MLLGAPLLAAVVNACADAPAAPAALPLTGPDGAPSLAMAASPSPSAQASLAVSFADVGAMGGFLEHFNVNPSDQATWVKPPAPWRPADWAIVRHARDRAAWYDMEPMAAWHHGTTCNPPPLTHTVSSYDESVFLCRNHMMTAVNAGGYAVTYLTPNRMVDFSSGAVVRFDVATLRASHKDWVDLWVTPYEDNLVAPLDDDLPDLQGEPQRAIHLRMTSERNRSAFEAFRVDGHAAVRLPSATARGYEEAFAAVGLTTSATRRDTFELHLSPTRIRFGMPRYGLWWVDAPVSGLGWTRGVVQIGHHSFNPQAGNGGPTTWHWDNVGIAPAVRFTILNASRRYVDAATAGQPVTFPRGAPAGSHLRFAAYGAGTDISVDGGRTWSAARRQVEEHERPNRFPSYWTPVPTGTASVLFRPTADEGKGKKTEEWFVRDISIWSPNAG
jgi:hypothetical protein